MTENVNEQTLVALVANGSVRSVRVYESPNGKYGIEAGSGMNEIRLMNQRKDVRMFASLDTAKRYLRNKIGINRFEVIGQ